MDYKYTSKQKREIRRLARAECANHFPDDGGGKSMDYCARRDTFCGMINPPDGKICEYFKKCVLPIDSTLEAELLFRDTIIKRCKKCGQTFAPNSNRAEYCKECAPKARHEKEAERLREYRARKRG